MTDVVDQFVQLEPHQQEHAILEQELRRAPVQALVHSRDGAELAGCVMPRVETGHDHREHARGANVLGGNKGDEAHARYCYGCRM